MKKILVFALLFAAASVASGQVTAKKYLLIEHFTNTKCSVCGSKNPAFYNLINQAQYADDVHHVSVHPMFPYPSCALYQANTTENSAWTGLYPISGTPSIVLNGTVQSPSTPLLSESKLQTYLNQTSPLHLKVTETGPDNARQVKVRVKALGDLPTGNYKLFVAIVEKKVNLAGGNGETVHHNVFRKMLTAVQGNDFTVPALGQTADYDFNYSVAGTWDPNEVYVLAFIKEVDTKTVVNSGTRFDPVLTDVQESVTTPITLFPNPVADFTSLDLSFDRVQTLELFALNGKKITAEFQTQGSLVNISTAKLPAGVYLVKITGDNGVYIGKFVKH